jgi:type I restriction enzyme S subunit
MESKTFFDNFVTIANAPGGIVRLRELILDLAIRGELVSSNRQAWKSSTLGEAVEIIRGVTFPASAKKRTPDKGLIPCLRTTNVQNEVDWDDLLYISEEFVRKDSQYVQLDDVLISMANSRELVGKVALVRRDDIRCTLGGFIAAIRCGETILPRFLVALLRVPAAREKLIDSSTQTTNIANISLGRLNPFELSLPPIVEQKRIVTKIDELMLLCDELEAAQNHRNSIRTAARKSAIDSISTATTAEELDIAWKRIRDNWLTIADTPESIASLRSLILGMAVRGKLVDQRESEGVGSEFVSQFSGSYKPLTAPKKMPFEIPEAWVWSYLGNVSINRDYERVPISKPERETRQGPYDYYGASGVIDSYDEFLFDKPLLLIGEDGANLVNRSTPIAFMARGKYWVNNHAHVLDSTSEHALEYLAIVINQMDLKPFLTGTAQPKLNQAKLNGLQIPVPPFDEQKRIVAKVEELMALCGELERCMAERNKLAKEIAGAVTAEVAA